MQEYRRPWGILFFGLIAAGIFLPRQTRADTRAVPEYSLYLTHNNTFRSRFAANATWNRDDNEFKSSAIEYDLDMGLGSFFRRYIFKDPNAEKSKFVTIRFGYIYFADLISNDADDDEHRGLLDATFRLPLGRAWLISDRNRAEVRHINDTESVRYRNRLRIERNMAFGKFRMTPYANGEGYYDGKSDEWNRADGTLGAEFPWRQNIVEIYFTWQFESRHSDHQTVGFTLQKHL